MPATKMFAAGAILWVLVIVGVFAFFTPTLSNTTIPAQAPQSVQAHKPVQQDEKVSPSKEHPLVFENVTLYVSSTSNKK